MRYVDISACPLPNGWPARAAAAKNDVAAGVDPDDRSAVWRDIKPELSGLLHLKCWFCESAVDRSDNAVDHFRPKKAVSDAAQAHLGYRWLAFELSNFRYSCTYCNSRRVDVAGGTAGGKACRFPLLEEADRVYNEGPINFEAPVLLDPCRLTDWQLIGCRPENGNPCPANDDATTLNRVTQSVEIYHLDREATCNARHQHVVELVSHITTAKALWPTVVPNGAGFSEFEDVGRAIVRKIKRNAPFSGDMIFVLKGFQSTDHPWIDTLLQAA